MAGTPVIALLTDFGTSDPFVGVMKGVIASICRQATLIDLTHEIRPQAVREASFHLDRSAGYFPEGTIFVCVVDPGVGTSRKPICLDTGRNRFIAPDNGLLTPIFDRYPDAACRILDNPDHHLPRPSATFHGRDIFSPVAAHLAAGLPFEQLGTAMPVTSCTRLPVTVNRPLPDGSGWQGIVVTADHFGNVVTSFDAGMVAVGCNWNLSAGSATGIPLVRTYGDVCQGMPLAYLGSSGMVEIAVRDGNAAEALQISLQMPVTLQRG